MTGTKTIQGIRRTKGQLSLGLLILFAFLCSCSNNNKFFKIEGKFNGINQGELYIYGTYGTHKLDTISVAKGAFEYRIPLEDTVTFVIVFPNFSELPVFGLPGTTIEVKGDAAHLKETEVKGTKDNEQMTAFRLQTSQKTPPEVSKAAAEFIKAHPQSPASRYILDKYFIRTPEADYQQASELAGIIYQATPDNKELARLSKQLSALHALQKGKKLPSFTATDVLGRNVSSADLYAKVNVISVWATWNYESISIQSQLQRLQKKYGNDLRILSVCIDANPKDCRRIVTRDSIKWNNVCDGRMWETPILQKIGLSHLPDNIITDSQGKIIGFSLNYQKLTEEIEKILGKREDGQPPT